MEQIKSFDKQNVVKIDQDQLFRNSFDYFQ